MFDRALPTTDYDAFMAHLASDGIPSHRKHGDKEFTFFVQVPRVWVPTWVRDDEVFAEFKFSYYGKMIEHPYGWRGFAPLGGGGPMGGQLVNQN